MNNKRKDSNSLGNQHQQKRKSSLGLRGWVGLQDDRPSSDFPSVSRPQPQAFSRSSMASQQSAPRLDFGGPSRIPRAYAPGPISRRSSSQDPPRRLPVAALTPDTQHHATAGLLLTPNQSVYGRSRSPGSLASSIASSRFSSARRTLRPPTYSGAPPKLKDERPVNDKAFQAAALTNIQSYLRNAGMHPIPKLKPMGIQDLINVFNEIIKPLGQALMVDKSNYITKISETLMNLGYPSVLPKSTFTAPSSSHAAQQHFAALSWLVDVVMMISKIERSEDMMFEPNMDPRVKGSMMALCDGYVSFRTNSVQTSEDEFYELLCKNMGVSVDAENELTAEVEEYREKLEQLRNCPESAETLRKVQEKELAEQTAETLRQKKNALADTIAKCKLKNHEAKDAIQHLDLEIKRLAEGAEELQDKVANQPMKITERESICATIRELRSRMEEKTNYIEKLQGVISNIDLEMSSMRKKLTDVTQDINCMVLENGMDESLKWTDIPLHTEASMDSLEQQRQLWTRYLGRLSRDLENAKATLKADKQKLTKMHDDVGKKKKELNSCKEEIRHLTSQINTLKMSNKEVIEKLDHDIKIEMARCVKVQEQLNNKPKLEQLEDRIKQVLDEKAALHDEHARHADFVENNFFPALQKIWEEFHQDVGEDMAAYDKQFWKEMKDKQPK